MPNDDSTPQMFEKRNGLSSVTTVSSHTDSLRSSLMCTSSLAMFARQPHVRVDGLRAGQLQIAPRQPFEKRVISASGISSGRPLSRSDRPGLVPIDQLVGVGMRQVVVGVDVQPPEQLLFPRRQRFAG